MIGVLRLFLFVPLILLILAFFWFLRFFLILTFVRRTPAEGVVIRR